MDSILAEIARKTLHMTTLKARNSDELDFTEVAVWQIKAALTEAYQAGERAGRAANAGKRP